MDVMYDWLLNFGMLNWSEASGIHGRYRADSFHEALERGQLNLRCDSAKELSMDGWKPIEHSKEVVLITSRKRAAFRIW